MSYSIEPSSFRDPRGQVFYRDGVVFRRISMSYKDDYEQLLSSGLYETLVEKRLLVSHVVADSDSADRDGSFLCIRPEQVPFISYPYEWCFGQLKDAALLTLRIQKIALEHGMSLKDCSAYNIQFLRGRPVLIDTLSFEKYVEGKPWVAYKQFCEHFLAPLALMSRRDIRLGNLMRTHMDGIPLDMSSRLLSARTCFDMNLLLHIHLHARSQLHFAGKAASVKESRNVSKPAIRGLIDSLETAVQRLAWQPRGTEWADYYADTNYSKRGEGSKIGAVSKYLDMIRPKTVWDLGANIGIYSRLASSRGIQTISFDADPAAVQKSYADMTSKREENILPLLMDLANPSPALGWASGERMSLIRRGPADVAMALALIHHLAISKNIPLAYAAEFLHRISRWLIIEFVPKDDSQVQRLLACREDIFPEYTREAFERAFTCYFAIKMTDPIADSGRVLYLMERKERI